MPDFPHLPPIKSWARDAGLKHPVFSDESSVTHNSYHGLFSYPHQTGIHKLTHPFTLPNKDDKMHSTSPIKIPAPTRPVVGLATSSSNMAACIYKALKTLIFHLAPLALLILFYLIFSCAHCLRCVLINCSFPRVAVCLSMYLLIKTNNI